MYFEKLDRVEYNGIELFDILSTFKIPDNIKNDETLYDPYLLADGEKSEDVAFLQYDNVKLYAIILLFNDVKDPFNEWAMSVEEFEQYIDIKYGESKNDPHHYIDNRTKEIIHIPIGKYVATNYFDPNYIEDVDINYSNPEFNNLDAEFVSFVSALDYETTLNNNRKTIKLPKKEIAIQLLKDMNSGEL